MNKYRKGADKERQLKHLLEKWGWFVVRSAGSKGELDLVAIRNGRAVGLQVKIGRIGQEEMQQLSALAARLSIPVYAVLWNKEKRKWLVIGTDGERYTIRRFK